MLRTLTDVARFLDHYRYYRRNGATIRSAWRLAGMTLP